MATFGTTTALAAPNMMLPNTKLAVKFTVPTDCAEADKIYCFCEAGGVGAVLTGAIYTDTAGAPDALVANSAVTMSAPAAAPGDWSVYDYSSGTKPVLTGGNDYWLCVQASVDAVIVYSDPSGTTPYASNSDTLPLDDPFGAFAPLPPTTDNSIYVEYTSTTISWIILYQQDRIGHAGAEILL